MSSVLRSVLGAALLLTGVSAAMAASDNPPVADQSLQAGAAASTAASDSPAVADQTVQTAANTPIADQSAKPHHSPLCDNTDAYGGHGPNTLWGIRAFWDGQSDTQ